MCRKFYLWNSDLTGCYALLLSKLASLTAIVPQYLLRLPYLSGITHILSSIYDFLKKQTNKQKKQVHDRN